MNHNDTSSCRPRRALGRPTALALLAAAALIGLTACAGSGDGSTASVSSDDHAKSEQGDQGEQPNAKLPKLLWMGDSIGEAEAPALGAALEAGGTSFTSMAAAGGGGVVGEIAKPTWDELPKKLKSAAPDVVAYQITTYDWGTPAEQRKDYERLAKTVNDAGAELVLVTAPPFKIDDFYKPHEAQIKTAAKSAEDVAAEHPDKVHFLDASALWGTDSSAKKAQRSKDGIHSCQQGSAAFAQWLSTELGKLYAYTPAPADQWATGSWTGDKVYGPLGCK
ncbi:SGNH/GDSL hydrolase family protein [Streptomyces sp. NPDC041068]|uniref:SGNH/GDSL hydrolase family protein n=1 Tax=Streptomyces sp. NPDC041068 TaxID=3155130 RepID=UPI003402703A